MKPVCAVFRWDQTACGGAGDFRPILMFPPQPRRAKHEPIAPPVIDLVEPRAGRRGIRMSTLIDGESPEQQRVDLERGKWTESLLPNGPAGPATEIHPPVNAGPKTIVIPKANLEAFLQINALMLILDNFQRDLDRFRAAVEARFQRRMTSSLLEAATAVAILGASVLAGPRRDKDDEHEHAEENTYGLPDGEPIAAELRDWLRRQQRRCWPRSPTTGPDGVPGSDGDQWTDPMAKRMTPLLGAYWSESARKCSPARARPGRMAGHKPAPRSDDPRSGPCVLPVDERPTERSDRTALRDLGPSSSRGWSRKGRRSAN